MNVYSILGDYFFPQVPHPLQHEKLYQGCVADNQLVAVLSNPFEQTVFATGQQCHFFSLFTLVSATIIFTQLHQLYSKKAVIPFTTVSVFLFGNRSASNLTSLCSFLKTSTRYSWTPMFTINMQ